MKEFKALVRDTIEINNPIGTWQLGRNMLTTKKHKSISNEEGFSNEYSIKGTIIGFITTSKDIIYFSINEDGTNEIGVVNTNVSNPVYEVKLKSALFDFKLNCPIEGVFIYNYKEELTIAWCDGVKTNSNSPKTVNLDLPGFDVNPDGTFDDADFNKIEMFPNLLEAAIDIEYANGGNIEGSVAYITYAYLYADRSKTPFFSINNLAQLTFENDPVLRRTLLLTFTELDVTFTAIRVGLVIKREGELFGYESFDIPYTGSTLDTTINSLDNFTETSAESIILESSIFSKVQTMTKFENQLEVGNVHTAQSIDFQQYANLLEILPFQYTDDKINAPSLMGDEVYSTGVQVQLLNGSWSNNFHIPGRLGTILEKSDLSITDKNAFNLNWTDSESLPYKNFHVFNKGIALKTGIGNKMGYWENLNEVYPDKPEFDGEIKTDSGSQQTDDLRGTPIRYHRMPSLADMPIVEGGFVATHPNIHIEETALLKIGVYVTNFEAVVPEFIKAQIQGFRLTTVKRTLGNSYVAGNYLMTRGAKSPLLVGTIPEPLDTFMLHHNFIRNNEGLSGDQSLIWDFNSHDSRLLGSELQKFKPSIQITYTKIITEEFREPQAAISPIPADINLFAKIRDPLKYIPGNNIAADTEYQVEQIQIITDDEDYYTRNNTTDDINTIGLMFNIVAFTHRVDVYAGFSPSDFVILGRHSIEPDNNFHDSYFFGGDVYNDSIIDCWVHALQHSVAGGAWQTTNRFPRRITFRGLYTSVNSSELNRINEDDIDPLVGTTVKDPTPSNVPTEILLAEDYDFELVHEEDLSSIQDIVTIINYDDAESFVDKFPFRIHRGIKIPNESLSASALRTFLSSDYYEMPNDKGEIIALRGKERALFIQHRYTLFVASVKDKLVTDNVDAYLGLTDLFDRPPTELLSDTKGYVGSSSKFACVIIKGTYITINQVNGQIFIVKEGVKEITKHGNKQWFWDNWDIGLDYFEIDTNDKTIRIDNPFVSVGHLVGFDKQYDRLLFTKKMFKFIGDANGVTFDGEFYTREVLGLPVKLEFTNTDEFENLSKTFSYNVDSESWQFEHDYFPNIIFHTFDNLFSATNLLNGENRAEVYKHNDKTVKGLYYGVKFDSYVDLIFNQREDISKKYLNIKWITDVINSTKGNEMFKTLTHIMVYTSNQCSGIINLKDAHFEVTRNDQGEWHFNNFRDLVVDGSLPFINDKGEIVENNININKLWFDKSDFISKFIIVRLINDNVDNNDIHINQVDVNSILINKP